MTRLMKFVGRPYSGLNEGDVVKLLQIDPEYNDPTSSSGFTWPEYIIVETQDGKVVSGHSHRFELIDSHDVPFSSVKGLY